MIEKFSIAGYCRISVDEEMDRDNTSIENQKAIIEEFVREKFPDSTLTFYEDRDRSGYTFEQREGYQKMRRELMAHKKDILIIKDFSRFSRRNSRGLVELEDLRDAGVRIISIGDGIDFPNDDDWLKIQFQFLINEMPVTDTSKKVRSVVKNRQAKGEWICAAPYGYIMGKRGEFEIVPTEAEVVRKVYALYLDGWGYKKIANHLTDEGIPTPRMAERERKEAAGEEYHRTVRPEWSIITIQRILDNDFYIGTLRQGKFTRGKINGKDVRQDEDAQLVFEHHHQPIIDYRTFATVRAMREARTTSNYRGQKKYDNVYSGFLECGDCGSPMFAMSRKDLKDAYRCGLYHRRGIKACTSHHIRVETLDELLRQYIRQIKENSAAMLTRLNADLAREQEDVAETERTTENLEAAIADLQDELKATKRQRIRDIMKHPEQEAILDDTYDEMEADLVGRIESLRAQIELTAEKRNTIIRVNRAAKLAMDVFDDILQKPKLERPDLELIIDKIRVFEDHLDIRLKADMDTLLPCGTLPETEDAANFKQGMANISPIATVQHSSRHADKVYHANVINDVDPLEIYTEKDGEVIFKKYSPMGELGDFSEQICESMYKTAEYPTAVCDRDGVIAAAGNGRKDIIDRHISDELEDIMEGRRAYCAEPGARPVPVTDLESSPAAAVAVPILSEGDVLGCVVFLERGDGVRPGDVEMKLASTVAGFLGKQMEI